MQKAFFSSLIRDSLSPPGSTLRTLSHGMRDRCSGCEERNRTGLRLRFSAGGEHAVLCRVKLPNRFEGSSGCARGGVIAAMLDEAMSKANRLRGVVLTHAKGLFIMADPERAWRLAAAV